PQQMIAALDKEHLQAINDDVAAHPDQARFKNGWTYRAMIRWVQAKMVTQHAADAARWLNGQSRELRAELFARRTSAEIAARQEAALSGAGVGPDSQFARLTKARHDAYAQRPAR